MENKKKTIFNILFLIALFLITIYIMFKGQDLATILDRVRDVKIQYILLGIILVIVFVCCESVIIKYLLWVVQIKWPLYKCVRYSFIGFFFSCITPSATGGQPAQIYYMKKEGLSIPTSTIILMLVTIEYKFVLVFIGLCILLFGQSLLALMSTEVQFYLYLGLALNIFCVTFMSFLVFLPNTSRYLMEKLYHVLGKLRLLKNLDKKLKKLSKSMDTYQEASVFLGKNKLAIFIVFIISFVQRLLLFFVTYIVYRSFGLHEHSALEITILQATISIAVDMLPLPGGMGISEHLFRRIFTPIFAGSVNLTLSAMLLSRGISYYALILISALVTFYSHLMIGRKKEKTL